MAKQNNYKAFLEMGEDGGFTDWAPDPGRV